MTDLTLPKQDIRPFPIDWQRVAWEMRLAVEQIHCHLRSNDVDSALDHVAGAIRKFNMLTGPICVISQETTP